MIVRARSFVAHCDPYHCSVPYGVVLVVSFSGDLIVFRLSSLPASLFRLVDMNLASLDL